MVGCNVMNAWFCTVSGPRHSERKNRGKMILHRSVLMRLGVCTEHAQVETYQSVGPPYLGSLESISFDLMMAKVSGRGGKDT